MTSASLKFCVFLAFVLTLGGCLTLRGVLVPVPAAAPGTSQLDMLVATTRSPSEPSEMFSGARGSSLSFANITVSIPPAEKRPQGRGGAVAEPHSGQSCDRVRDAQGRPYQSEAGSGLVQSCCRQGPEALRPCLYPWLQAYGYDRESSTYSRNALEDMLKALAKDPAVGEISILAHSMGNVVTLEACKGETECIAALGDDQGDLLSDEFQHAAGKDPGEKRQMAPDRADIGKQPVERHDCGNCREDGEQGEEGDAA